MREKMMKSKQQSLCREIGKADDVGSAECIFKQVGRQFGGSSGTRWLDNFINIQPFRYNSENLPNSNFFCQIKLNISPNSKLTLKIDKDFKNFAKSSHTGRKGRQVGRCHRQNILLFFCFERSQRMKNLSQLVAEILTILVQQDFFLGRTLVPRIQLCFS